MKTFNYKTLTIVLAALLSFSFSSYATNLATSATATASHEQQAAANAIDGNVGTRWETEAADPQWLAVTLDAVYSINSIKIFWEGASAQSYTVKVSTDSATWTQVYAKTDGAGSRWDDIAFASIDAKYIVMDGTERSTQWGYSIWELQVFEAVSDTENATLSSLKVDGDTIADFSSNTKEYTYFVEDGMVPTVTATPSIVGANVSIIPAAAIPGTTTVVVTATDGITKDTTNVNFKEPIGFPLDFEANSADYQWGDFGAPTTVIANPQSSGINTSSQVAQVVKNAGPDWAGSFITIDSPFSLSSEQRVTAKFYSPRSGINMMMKLEDASGYATAEIQVPTTVANQWETLIFDFAGADLTKDYVKIVIICDRATVGDGTADHTYLVDDIKLYEADPAKNATLSNLKVDGFTIDNFESGDVDYTYIVSSAIVPATTAVPTTTGADVEITPATSIPGTTTVKVTSTDGTVDKTYSILYTEQPVSDYCDKETWHLDIPAEVASAISLTIEKIDATSMYVEIESTTDDPIDLLLVNGSGAAQNVLDDSTPGIYKRTLTFSSTPVDVSFEILWSKLTQGGNWMLNTFTVPFDVVCPSETPTSLKANLISELRVYPNPTTGILNIDAAEGELVTIYNLVGQLEKQVSVTGGTISIENLKDGVYFINVNSSISRIIKK